MSALRRAGCGSNVRVRDQRDPVFDPPRDLSGEERAMLDKMIEANPEHADALQLLFRDTKVTSICWCGCGSPHLTLNGSPKAALGSWRSRLEGEVAAKVEDVTLTAMLVISHEEEAREAWLEISWDAPEEFRPGRLPRPDELEIAQWVSFHPGQKTLRNFMD